MPLYFEGAKTASSYRVGRSHMWAHTALLAVALSVAVVFLFLRPDTVSNDFGGHLAYLNHIRQEPLSPFGYTGRESWHPPTYYYLTAISEQVGSWLGLRPLRGARLFSIFLYVLYVHFALRSFHLLFQGRMWWCASLLFIAWPSNYELSSRLNSDAALLPIYSAVQFYVLRSVFAANLQDSLRALSVSCVGLLFKTSALVPFAVASVFTVGLSGWLRMRSPERLHRVSRLWIPALIVTFLLCVSVNMSRPVAYWWSGIRHKVSHLGGQQRHVLNATQLLAFRPSNAWENPFSDPRYNKSSALEFAFKSALFTEQPSMGRGKFLGRMWVVLILFQFFIVFVALVRCAPGVVRRGLMLLERSKAAGRLIWDEDENKLSEDYPEGRKPALLRWGILAVLALLPIIGLLVFTWKQNWVVCSNFRFVQASLVAWIGLLLMPAYGCTNDCQRGALLGRIGWLGAFTITTWGIVCLLLKAFRPWLGWG